MTTFLILGPVVFEEFEIPNHINFGGSQALSVKQLVGGQRIIDAMGRFDDDITWSGLFFGGTAVFRARFLDQMRSQGLPWSLIFSIFNYSVVIKDFKASYERDYQIPYSITVTVIQNLSLPIPILLPASFGDAIDDLMTAAGNLGLLTGNASVIAALSALQTAVSAVPDFSKASSAQIASVVAPLLIAQSVTSNAISGLNTGGLFG